jgi:hypothetical protein
MIAPSYDPANCAATTLQASFNTIIWQKVFNTKTV